MEPVPKPVSKPEPEKPKQLVARPPEPEAPTTVRPEIEKPVEPVSQQSEKPVSNGFSGDPSADRIEPVQSPKPWYKKKPFIFEKVIGGKSESQDTGSFPAVSFSNPRT